MHLLTVFLLPSFFVKLVQFTLSIHAFHHAFTFHHVGINFMVITWTCKEDFLGVFKLKSRLLDSNYFESSVFNSCTIFQQENLFRNMFTRACY